MSLTAFTKSCLAVVLGWCVLQGLVALWMLADPAAFHYRAWEYFFRWSNATIAENNSWHGEELPDLSRRNFFFYQVPRYTEASTDADGFRSVPADRGPTRILFQGYSNVFGSRLSDEETLPWRVSEQLDIGVFNGAHGKVLHTLSRPGLENVELVVDLVHELHFAQRTTLEARYRIKGRQLRPYQPLARRKFSGPQAMNRNIVRPAWWLPDVSQRFVERLWNDSVTVLDGGPEPIRYREYEVSDTTLSDVVGLLQQRRRTLEALGYRYLGVIIPSRQTILGKAPVGSRARGFGSRVAAALEEQGYPLVNLFPDFADRRDLVYAYDSHWNEAGVRVAAARIAARSTILSPQ